MPLKTARLSLHLLPTSNRVRSYFQNHYSTMFWVESLKEVIQSSTHILKIRRLLTYKIICLKVTAVILRAQKSDNYLILLRVGLLPRDLTATHWKNETFHSECKKTDAHVYLRYVLHINLNIKGKLHVMVWKDCISQGTVPSQTTKGTYISLPVFINSKWKNTERGGSAHLMVGTHSLYVDSSRFNSNSSRLGKALAWNARQPPLLSVGNTELDDQLVWGSIRGSLTLAMRHNQLHTHSTRHI